MAEISHIEWTDSTFNPWEGCQKVGPGCDHCYAEARNARFGGGAAPNWGPGAPRRRTSAANWNQPRRWQREAAAFFAEHGRRRRVFCASLADVFDNAVVQSWRDDLWQLIRETPDLEWIIVTKRIGNARDMLPLDWGAGWRHVILMATVVNQQEADRDIPKLIATPAKRRGLSMEPLLGPVDLRQWIMDYGCGCGWGGAPLDYCRECGWRGFAEERCPECDQYIDDWNACPECDGHDGDGGSFGPNSSRLNWIIVGGESGTHARPMNPDWARSLRDQCASAGVAFFFKQWGEWLPEGDWYEDHPVSLPLRVFGPEGWTDDPRIEGEWMARIGKKAAGQFLDGSEHKAWPEVRDAI